MEQVLKSEQISPNTSLIIDYDQPLRSSTAISKAFSQALGEECSVEKYQNTKTVYKYQHNDITHYFLSGAVTYLSKPHPIFKKRFQLKKWYKDFYREYKGKPNTKIHLIGLYHYEGLVVFVEFALEDYIERKLNSSAAHVYSNDIYQAVTIGCFSKVDRNNNHVTSVSSRYFKQYLNGEVRENPLFELFKKFNSTFCFDEWISAKQAILQMKQGNWYQWKGTEWPGWFLEYEVAGFVSREHCEAQMLYIGNIKGTRKNMIPLVIDDYGYRKLTLRECLDFQGFPKDFYFPKTITIEDAYKQIGNSVCVPVIKRIADRILEII